MKPKRLLNDFGPSRPAPASRMLLAVWLLTASLLPARAHSQEEAPLSEEFLEFLGGWETASGEWLDPAELAALMPEAEAQDEDKTDAEN